MTYYDRLNQFFRHIVYNEIPPHAQLVYLHLLNHNNQLGWQEKFCITDRRLELLTGLSKQSVTDAKRILKDRFVTISTDKKKPRKGSCYTFINFLPYIQGKVEGKTQGKNEGKSQGKMQGKPSISPSISLSKIKEEEGDTDGARARVCGAEPTFGKLSAKIIAAWDGEPNWNDAYDLRALEERHGADAVVKAINAAKISLKGEPLTINYLRGTLRNMKERGELNNETSTQTQQNNRHTADDDINAEYYNLR